MKIRKGLSLLPVIFFSGWTIGDMSSIVRKNSLDDVGRQA
jgi:FtsH-binding integral membrane protein